MARAIITSIMLPLTVTLDINAMLPWLTGSGRALISAQIDDRGQFGNAMEMATRMRLGSRYRLRRLLQHEGLPAFGELVDWVSVLQFVWESEATDRSLLHLARRAAVDPATCDRPCQRQSAVPCSRAPPRGSGW